MEGLKRDLMNRLKEQLRPEFLNRVDEIVVFRPLGRAQIRRIVELQFERLRQMAAKNHGLDLVLTDAAKDRLAAEGFDPVFGARPLKRVLQREIANRLAEQILAGFVRDGDSVVVDAAPGGEGVTLTTTPSAEEAAATNGRATAPAAEA
jgi:ATP-dependent Clp protease ATP-binding subunit ClpB